MPRKTKITTRAPRSARRLQEAATRDGMKSVNAWLPHKLHRALALARVEDGIAINAAIREAVTLWLARRAARRRRKP